MILNEQIYRPSSLNEDISASLAKKDAVESSLLANIISKYIIVFALWSGQADGLSYSEYRERMKELLEELKKRENLESKIKSIKYQLQMVLDVPATMEVMLEIINRINTIKIDGSVFRGLDLWSGSGILMLAQYIWARRSGWNHTAITWIELDYSAQGLSDTVIRKLWIWKVLRWDSQNSELYPEESPYFISNENLSTRGIPFKYRWKEWTQFEPFLENIDTLSRVYWPEIFQKSEFFPRWLISWNSIDQVPSRAIMAEEQYGITVLRCICPWSNPAEYIYPIQIPIMWEWKNLDDIWNSVDVAKLFTWYREYRRWAHTSDEALRSIYWNIRARKTQR